MEESKSKTNYSMKKDSKLFNIFQKNKSEFCSASSSAELVLLL